MKFYYHPLSTYSQKVLWASYEKDIELEREIVNLMDETAKAEYRKIYPIGKVPLLVDGDRMVPESSIIVEYLENNYSSGAQLIPADPHLSRQARFFDRMNDLYLNDSIANLIFQSWKPEEQRDPELISRCNERIEICYGHLDELLGEVDWPVADCFTMADISAGPPLFYAATVSPFANRPNLTAYWERLCERPAWQRVMEEVRPYWEKMQPQAAE